MKKKFGNINKTTFFVSVAVYLFILLFIIFFPVNAGNSINSVLNFTIDNFGWFYVAAVVLFLAVFLYLGLGKYKDKRLGGEDAKPEYSFFSWMAMLFGCGLGIGLVFFGVTEPVMHFMTSPFTDSGTAQAAAQAMRQTFFHWGIPFWVMYGIIGLCMGYFTHTKGKSLLISSSFYPMIGEKGVKGAIGKIIDSFSLIAVISGVAMALGVAATQLSSGLNIQYGFNNSFFGVSMVAIVIAAVATISCISGVSKGIKYMGDFNMYVVLAILVFTLVFGSTSYLLSSLLENYGNMLQNLPWLLFYGDSYGIAASNTGYNWIGGWTIMYWAWSAAFGPFCGAFLAEISKGRTFKQFVLAVTFVPGLLCCVWFTFTGGEAIHMIMGGNTELGAAIVANSNTSLFVFFQQLPLSGLTIPVAFVLIFTLIVTTVNAATHIAGKFSCNGENATFSMNLFWGVFIVSTALAFLAIGGLDTLKSASIVLAFPFTIIVVLMIINLFKDLNETAVSSGSTDISKIEKDPNFESKST